MAQYFQSFDPPVIIFRNLLQSRLSWCRENSRRPVIVMCVIITKADLTGPGVGAPSSSAPGSRLINNWHPSLVRQGAMTMSGQAGGNKHTDWLIENWEQGQVPQFPISDQCLSWQWGWPLSKHNYLLISSPAECREDVKDVRLKLSLIIILSLLQLADAVIIAPTNFASPQMGKLVHNAIISP